MISRYQTEEMKELWSEQNKFSIWQEIEILVCEIRAERGEIPLDDAKQIRSKAAFDIKRILELEETLQHDVIAFLTNLSENIGPAARHVHYGMTSSDLLDTALAVQMTGAADILVKELDILIKNISILAKKNKNVLCIGRSHGIHAEPTTFGLKMALFFDEMKRCKKRLLLAKEIVRVGQISGPVGTHSNLDIEIENELCQKLGLEPASISTQILQRDRHAEFLTNLALVASSLEKYATEFRNLQRTEILEVEEGFKKGQKGSSAMPHKKNPITSERIVGLARVIRSNSIAAMENVALWHERDITHSSTERVIIPDSSIALHYILRKMNEVVSNLQINSDRMMQNVELTRGLVFSGPVLLMLTDKGLTRESAYSIVQDNAMRSWKEGKEFRDLLLKEERLTKELSEDEINELFDYNYFIKNVDAIFEKVGLGDNEE